MRQALLVIAMAAWAQGPVEFRPHLIDGKIPGGYSVLVADLNKDGKPDVIGLTQRITELAWYENPNWERHVLVSGLTGLVNMAAHDLDGDGIPEVAVENEFNMVAAKSKGLVWIAKHVGDSRQPWQATRVDELTTSHHIAFADVDGDGKTELINAPLIGSKALAPKYEDFVPLVFYRVPGNWQGWKRETVDEKLYGVLHRVRVVKWDQGKRDQLLTASFSGITLHKPSGKGASLKWDNIRLSKGHEEEAPRAGTSDVAVGQIRKKRFLAAVEPWHGNEVVVYTQAAGGKWDRRVLFSDLREGHEVCVGDFNGDGRDDIVAGDRARGERGSAHVFYAQDDAGLKWEHQVIDPQDMSGSGCAVRDMNGDGRPDFVMIGSATGNLKWYENLGPKR